MSKTPTTTLTRSNTYCTFRLAGRLFGFDILSVREVNIHTSLTPIPHAPATVRGYANLRGHIYLILDLKLLLGMEPIRLTPETRLVICKSSVGESFGVLVDEIGAIVRVEADAIERLRAEEVSRADDAVVSGQGGSLLAGVGKLEGELLLIVDAYKLLAVVGDSMRAR